MVETFCWPKTSRPDFRASVVCVTSALGRSRHSFGMCVPALVVVMCLGVYTEMERLLQFGASPTTSGSDLGMSRNAPGFFGFGWLAVYLVVSELFRLLRTSLSRLSTPRSLRLSGCLWLSSGLVLMRSSAFFRSRGILVIWDQFVKGSVDAGLCFAVAMTLVGADGFRLPGTTDISDLSLLWKYSLCRLMFHVVYQQCSPEPDDEQPTDTEDATGTEPGSLAPAGPEKSLELTSSELRQRPAAPILESSEGTQGQAIPLEPKTKETSTRKDLPWVCRVLAEMQVPWIFESAFLLHFVGCPPSWLLCDAICQMLEYVARILLQLAAVDSMSV